ncbi:hypothetical protein QJS04_geneDACA019694 [Acorus gramineus]|uniref:Uncharacterized protein n=1 Tax=Acorus gramineus TaxID=55184 RepID=A0AAV9B057_ACOGR|nr:hypothetical protein QJS04_geneDACA019694 [Acorus gramineus]
MGGEKQLELSQFLRAHKSSFISLQETKLTAAGYSVMKRKLIHHDSSFLSSAGRICLFWNNELYEADHIMSRLDRILVNSAFINDSPLSMVNYLAPGISDHSPMHVICEQMIPSGPKPFKYFEMWEAHPSFKSTVETAWATEVVGTPLYCLVKKIAATKLALKQWNKATFGPIQHMLRRSRENLAEIQDRLQLHPMDQNLLTEEQLARAQYQWKLQQEECFLRQKSRQLWLSSGDSNSRFFYDSLMSRTTVNTIRSLHFPDGEELTDPAGIKEHIVEYFSNLLNRDYGCTVSPLRSYGTISNLENQSLLAPISPEEIRKATLSLKPLSSPGPDDKIRKRVSSWAGHSLSKAGRAELIRAVLSSFQIFWSSAFRIPRKTQKEIEKLFRDFFWQGHSQQRKMHQVSWDTICNPLEEGGLGIKSIHDWSVGSIGVHFWELANKNQSMWAKWMRQRYLRKDNIWRVSAHMGCSSTWSSILQARDWIQPKVQYLIFEGGWPKQVVMGKVGRWPKQSVVAAGRSRSGAGGGATAEQSME